MFAPTFTESSTVSSEGSTESSEIFFHIAETETIEKALMRPRLENRKQTTVPSKS